MMHRLAFAAFLVYAAAAAAAQHPQHLAGSGHDRSDHPSMDPEQHAVLHALMHGTWTGSLSSSDGSSPLDFVVGADRHGAVTFKMSGPARLGEATNIAVT